MIDRLTIEEITGLHIDVQAIIGMKLVKVSGVDRGELLLETTDPLTSREKREINNALRGRYVVL